MSEESEKFLEKMQEFFPLTREEYIKSIRKYGKVLETVIIEDIFVPQILILLTENKKNKLLGDIFNYFEEIVSGDDSHLINIFFITVLEILGNDKVILEIAKQYMGPKTTLLQMEVDGELGRL